MGLEPTHTHEVSEMSGVTAATVGSSGLIFVNEAGQQGI